jgi:hypothetical protein
MRWGEPLPLRARGRGRDAGGGALQTNLWNAGRGGLEDASDDAAGRGESRAAAHGADGEEGVVNAVQDVPEAISVLGKGKEEREWLTLPAAASEALVGWLRFRGADPGPLFLNLDRSRKGDPDRRLSG